MPDGTLSTLLPYLGCVILRTDEGARLVVVRELAVRELS